MIVKIDHVKIDFVNYKYSLLKDIVVKNNIRMRSIKDRFALKSIVIAEKESKKDFFLLKECSVR